MGKSIQEVLKNLQPTNQPEQAVIEFKSFSDMNKHLQKEFPGINPTSNDFYKGFLSAYSAAAVRSSEQEKEVLKQQRINHAKEMWDYDTMKRKAIEAGQAIAIEQSWKKPFIIDQHNENVLHLLCLYFTNDPRFEEYGNDGLKYSLNKGIWLQSEIRGSGKTILLQCFRFNKRCCFGYIHSAQLGNIFIRRNFEGIDPYMTTTEQPPTGLNFYQKEAGFMYDELFSEGEFNGWGTKLFPSKHIINSLYDFSTNKKGQMWKFHITSNHDGNDIEQVAGKTFRSRMPDMFNLIKLGGPNRRV